MAAIEALASAYGDDSDSEGNESPEEEVTPDHTAHLKAGVSISQLQSKIQLKSAPTVTAKVGVQLFHTLHRFWSLSLYYIYYCFYDPQEDVGVVRQVDPTTKEVTYNPKYEEMFSPEV